MFSQCYYQKLCNIYIMSFFGVEINSQVNRLVLQIRLKLAQNKVSPNFRTLYRSFAGFDKEATGCISPALFEKGLNQNGFFFKKFEYQAFQKALVNQKGLINWFQFLSILREPMGPHRREVVEQIFAEISKGNNEADLSHLQQKFHSATYDSFQKITKNLDTSLGEFITLAGVRDSIITKDQFISYYDDLSVNFPHDDVFIRFVTNQWKVKYQKPEPIKEQDIKSIIKAFRFKLIQKTQGTDDQFLLKKLFAEFDKNKNGSIGGYQLDLLLKKLELPVASKFVTPLLQQLDKNKSGYIEYDELKRFTFFDSFPK